MDDNNTNSMCFLSIFEAATSTVQVQNIELTHFKYFFQIFIGNREIPQFYISYIYILTILR